MSDEQLKDQLRHWRIAPPREGLEEAILASAFALPQRCPPRLALMEVFRAWIFSHPRQLAYQLAGLALCALVGYGAGWQMHLPHAEIDPTAIAFGHTDAEEPL